METSLAPLLSKIVIPPELINIILDTEPGDKWIPAIEELELRITAIRSGPRVAARQSLDNVAEKLRIKVRLHPSRRGILCSVSFAQAADKLRRFFVDLLVPFRTSIATDIQAVQASQFLKYRFFYAFLQRHATRQAHEVQKAYVAAASWYYETGFRRYTRALAKVRARSLGKDESVPGQSADGSLGASRLISQANSLTE